MAWTTPGTATAGNVLTAAFWNENVRDNSIMGSPVYTNEAARDAAITAPSEGMQCYLTAPTVPAATGGITAVPTGVRTVYNGSVWVCITSIIAMTTDIGDTTSSSYTATLTSGGTNPSVTLVTGTTARISISCNHGLTAAGSPTLKMSVAVSGASTLAANDNWGVASDPTPANFFQSSANTAVITGLTAGTNTFTLQYLSTTGATGRFRFRNICVEGIA